MNLDAYAVPLALSGSYVDVFKSISVLYKTRNTFKSNLIQTRECEMHVETVVIVVAMMEVLLSQ